MLQRIDNQWHLYPYKVHYTQHGEQQEQWALPSKEWWTDFADKWSHTTIDRFEDIEVTEVIKKRYEEIKDMPEDFGELYSQYVLTGDIGNEDLPVYHPFNIIRLRKENNDLQERLKTSEEAILTLMDLNLMGGM